MEEKQLTVRQLIDILTNDCNPDDKVYLLDTTIGFAEVTECKPDTDEDGSFVILL